jgi:hypothetical protein
VVLVEGVELVLRFLPQPIDACLDGLEVLDSPPFASVFALFY